MEIAVLRQLETGVRKLSFFLAVLNVKKGDKLKKDRYRAFLISDFAVVGINLSTR